MTDIINIADYDSDDYVAPDFDSLPKPSPPTLEERVEFLERETFNQSKIIKWLLGELSEASLKKSTVKRAQRSLQDYIVGLPGYPDVAEVKPRIAYGSGYIATVPEVDTDD